MSPKRTAAFVALVLLGYTVLLPGQLGTIYLDQTMIWTAFYLGDAGRWLVNVTWTAFPPGTLVAVGCILIGTLLAAVGIAAGSQPTVVTVESRPVASGSTSARMPSPVLLGIAAVLAGITLYICRSPEPTNVAVATWATSMLCGAAAFVRIDRARGTHAELAGNFREAAVAVLLGLLTLVVVGHDLTSWRWSGTPDETHFFGVAKSMANGTSERFLLSERGVFEVHPTLSSAYQTAFMLVFGISGLAWRLSSAAALAASVSLLYLLARRLWNGRVAAIAALLFGTTPVAVGFAHLGYNNAQLYPVVIGAPALLVWAHARGSVAGMYLAGCLAGLGFYTYYPARLTLVLVVVLGSCLGALPLRSSGRVRTAALFAGFLLALVPVVAHPLETFGRMSQFTRFTEGGALRATDLASAWQLVSSVDVSELVNQSLLASIYSVYFVGPHHFQWPPVVDPISGPLTIIGVWLCLGGWRRANARFLAIAFVLSAVLIGGTSHYFRPPLTRLLFLSPFAALLAAVALDRLASAIAGATRSPRFGAAFAATMTAAAVVWGVVWLQYNVRYRYHGYGDGTTAELVRLALQHPDDTRFVYVQRKDTSMWSVDGVFDQYGMRERLSYHQGFSEEAKRALETTPPPFVAVLSLTQAEELRDAVGIMRQRVPDGRWQSSDEGREWNLRYFTVAASPPP